MSAPRQFRKKPVVIEAMQWTSAEQAYDLVEWAAESAAVSYEEAGAGPSAEDGSDWGRLSVETLEGEHVATPGDWLIRGVVGEFYFCKPNVFDATYEATDPAVSA